MTAAPDLTDLADAATTSRREAHRAELADLLVREPAELTDDALLVEQLCLDSLAMMVLLTWLEALGIVVGNQHALRRVSDVLAMLDRQASLPALVIVAGDDTTGQPGPGTLPTLPTGPRPPVDPLVPVLATRAFRMSPIGPGDLVNLYALATHPQTGFRWRYRGGPPPFDQFAKDLWTHVLAQYVVRPTGSDQAVGLVVAYGADEGHVYLGAVFDPAHTGTGLAAQVVQLFVRYLFHTFPLRKVYLEIAEFNWPQLCSGGGRLFEVEGVLRGHHYYAGRHWDQYIVAIYPDRDTHEPAPGLPKL